MAQIAYHVDYETFTISLAQVDESVEFGATTGFYQTFEDAQKETAAFILDRIGWFQHEASKILSLGKDRVPLLPRRNVSKNVVWDGKRKLFRVKK